MYQLSDGQADALAEKSLFELQQDPLNDIAQLRKDVDNRFTFEAADIAKRYVEGRLKVCLEFRTRRGGKEFIGFFGRSGAEIIEGQVGFLEWDRRKSADRIEQAGPICAPGSIFDGKPNVIGIRDLGLAGQVLAASRTEDECLAVSQGQITNLAFGAQIYGHKSHSMLVSSIGGMQQPKQRIPSFVWLQALNKGDCIVGELFLFSKGGFEFIEIKSEGELNSRFGSLGYADDYFREHLIKGGTKVVEDLPHSDQEIVRELSLELEAPNFFIGLWIDLGYDFVRGGLEEGLDRKVEIIDLGFGSLGLGKRGYKRPYQVHDINSIRCSPRPKNRRHSNN
jgi:hypothetical protein